MSRYYNPRQEDNCGSCDEVRSAKNVRRAPTMDEQGDPRDRFELSTWSEKSVFHRTSIGDHGWFLGQGKMHENTSSRARFVL